MKHKKSESFFIKIKLIMIKETPVKVSLEMVVLKSRVKN